MEQSDQDSGSNCNNSARQSDFSVPAVVVEAKMESSSGREMKQSHYVLGSQDRREEDLRMISASDAAVRFREAAINDARRHAATNTSGSSVCQESLISFIGLRDVNS